MNSQQQKFQKKKEREREKRKKILRRRQRIRTEAKVEDEKQREEREAQRLVNRHTVTVWHDKNVRLTEEEIKARLARNMEILKALEEEYEAERKLREENQKQMPEMMNKLREQQIKFQQQPLEQEVRNWGGEAEVEFKPNLPEEKPDQPNTTDTVTEKVSTKDAHSQN